VGRAGLSAVSARRAAAGSTPSAPAVNAARQAAGSLMALRDPGGNLVYVLDQSTDAAAAE